MPGGINPNRLISHSFPVSGKGKNPEGASASHRGESARRPETRPETGAAPRLRRADSMPVDMAAAHAAQDRAPLAPLPKRKYTPAEKGKGKAEEPAASSLPHKGVFEKGESSGTAHEKPLPGREADAGSTIHGLEPHGPGAEAPEALRASSAPRGDGSEASLKHYVGKPPSDEWNETMTLRDYIGHLNTKAGSSGSSGSGSDVLAAAGYDVNAILAKNGRLADMESRYFAPKMDPKFERTVENSPGYQKYFDPDNHEGPQRPRDHWLEKERPFASLPPELRKEWDDDPMYMPKHELERRYDRLKSENAGLRADHARLQDQVEGLQAEVGDAKADLKKAEKEKLKMGALGALGGLAAGTVAGMVLDSGGSANPPDLPQNPAVL